MEERKEDIKKKFIEKAMNKAKKKDKKKNKNKSMFKDKRMNILVGKIGLTEQEANWCINIHKKYAIWIGNEIIKNKDLLRREGDFRLIIDWKREQQQLNLNEYTFEKALEEARKAHGMTFKENANSLKNQNVVLDLGEFKWVQLKSVQDCQEEGNAMGHCIGGGGHSNSIASGRSVAFSLRDEFNRPHLTLEADSQSGRVFEFKGRSNGVPQEKYVECYVALAQKYAGLLGTVTDYSFAESIKKNFALAQSINAVNSKAIPQEIKMQLGLNAFNEGELVMQSLTIGSVNTETSTQNKKEFLIPKGMSIYGMLELNQNKLKFQEDIRVGGNVKIKANKVKIGRNLLIGGNLMINSKDIGFNVGTKVCGDLVLDESLRKYETMVREKIVFGGRLIFKKF